MKSALTRILLICLTLALGACAGMSIFDGPPVPYGNVTLNGKTVIVKRMGVDCMCPAIPATDSPVAGAVLAPRAGCNDGSSICTPPSIYVYEHEALEVATGLRHSDTPNPLSGCYDIQTGGGEYRQGDQLCVGFYGDYRIAGRIDTARATTTATTATTPAPQPAAPLALRMSPVCDCQPHVAVARRRVAAKAA
jgi:hypothetical protein